VKRAVAEDGATRFERCVRAFDEELAFLFRVLRRHGVQGADLEDVVQEVFLVLWRRWDDFQADRPLRPWLAGIAVRLAYKNVLRRRREIPSDELEPVHTASPLDDRVAARALLARALADVPQTNRMAVVLHDLEGLPMPEVARALNVPLATAYTRLGRGRRAFEQAARRLQSSAPADRHPLLVPLALLELGRREPEAPASGLRERLLARARATAWQAPAAGTPGALLRSVGRRPLAAVAVGIAAALLIGALALRARRTHAPVIAARSSRPAAALASRQIALTSAPATPPVLALPAAAAPAAAAALAHGLTGYWRFEDGPESALVRDLSGRGNDCGFYKPDTGRAWTAGIAGGSMRLGDGTARLSCPQPAPAPAPSHAVTVAVWVKPQLFRKYDQAVVTRQREDDGRPYFFLGVKARSVVLLSDVWGVRLVHPLPWILDRWIHLAFTHAADGTTQLYVNGAASGLAAGLAGEERAIRSRISLGFTRDPATGKSSQAFHGLIDELAIYDRVLDGEEIAALASGAQPGI
jgi:RNA polymerase sigma-70 factor (ECF subfamily)